MHFLIQTLFYCSSFEAAQAAQQEAKRRIEEMYGFPMDAEEKEQNRMMCSETREQADGKACVKQEAKQYKGCISNSTVPSDSSA